MKNTYGNSIAITLFGESHGETIGAVLDGIAPGIEIDPDFIDHQLSLRRPAGRISTARVESDNYRIVSGVFEGKTTGTPICILIDNENKKSSDYTRGALRPSHADFTANEKYHGFEDYRGGGHFSGRLTAPVVAAGAILISALAKKGIYIGTHIKKCRSISDRELGDLKKDIEALSGMAFPVLDENAASSIRKEIEKAAEAGDSVGGILETAVVGIPSGVGEPWFDSLEGALSRAMFAIPAIKGIEFGKGFEFSELYGSEANDAFSVNDGKIVTESNNNGGINGGISNGMPIIFRTVVKPTPSIYKAQKSVDVENMSETELQIKGRHDPAIFHRARVVVDSMTAIALADMLAFRFGTDWLFDGDLGDKK